MKQCSKCNEIKGLDAFPFKSTAAGTRGSICKVCAVKDVQARQRTLAGLIKKIFHNQRMTTKKMGRPAPAYTEQELFEWAMRHGYQAMWQAWTDSSHDKWLSPSIDRKDNTKSYTLDNIRLVTWRENLDNQKTANITGEYLHTGSKAVDQLALDGTFIRSYPSVAIAIRSLKGERVGASNITAVCSGKWPTAYGYRWRFSQP